MDVAPNGPTLQTLGRKFAYFNNYTPQQSINLYATDGTTIDFAYGTLGVAAYTFEIGIAFFESCDSFVSTVIPENMPALLYAAKVVRTPYQTPAGPEALNVTASPANVPRAARPPSRRASTTPATRAWNRPRTSLPPSTTWMCRRGTPHTARSPARWPRRTEQDLN